MQAALTREEVVQETRAPQTRWLGYYLLLTYPALLATMGLLLRDVGEIETAGAMFLGAVFLTYGCTYLLPLAAALGLGAWLASRLGRAGGWLLGALAIGGAGALQFGIYLDAYLHHVFGFHVNGFVLNVITTPGGLRATGGNNSTWLTLAAIGAGLVTTQGLLALLAHRLAASHPLRGRARWLALAAGLLLALGLGERAAYGLARFYRFPPVLVASRALPLYVPVTFNKLLKRAGLEQPRAPEGLRLSEQIRLRYPLEPLARRADAQDYNVVWLVAESLRADALEEMPRTRAFADRHALRFTHHLSGGNGTRWGMFSMFYGLYGNLWHAFLDERRGPVLIDEVVSRGYQLSINTSARFSYPEFDATLFSAVPRDRLHESDADATTGWSCDRDNVTRILDFLDGRDPQRPFFAFQFFESTHAPYSFPAEAPLHDDYTREYNYVAVDMQAEAKGLHARFENAAHYLDSQLNRLFAGLEERGLLERTIVIVTGDHGEEFMEHGRMGHNSQFSDEQIRVPLLLHVPGRGPAVVESLSSHLDLPATVLTALGVSTPAKSYSLGQDLIGAAPRSWAVLSDWSHVAYVDREHVATYSLQGFDERQGVRTRAGLPLAQPQRFEQEIQPRLMEIMTGLRRFSR
ncbi:MAG TPA: hypothetical protein DEA08_15330 [Planctomycetes bacterium]|nr:hypothetical protein [Planctomycetota bacterium]